MGGFRASEADIKSFVWEALQTKLKQVNDTITSTDRQKERYLSGNKPFWVGLVETDDEFPGEGYHDWKNCGIPEDQLKKRLEFRYQTFDANLLLMRSSIGSAISCIMPFIQPGTLKTLAQLIQKNDYSQLVRDGLRMIRSRFDDVAKKLDTPGFITQLEADYSKGRRRSEYEKAVIINHIDDTNDWLNGRYMQEVTGEQPQKQHTKKNTAKEVADLFFDKYVGDKNSDFAVLKEGLGRGTSNEKFPILWSLFQKEHPERIKEKDKPESKGIKNRDSFYTYLNKWRKTKRTN